MILTFCALYSEAIAKSFSVVLLGRHVRIYAENDINVWVTFMLNTLISEQIQGLSIPIPLGKISVLEDLRVSTILRSMLRQTVCSIIQGSSISTRCLIMQKTSWIKTFTMSFSVLMRGIETVWPVARRSPQRIKQQKLMQSDIIFFSCIYQGELRFIRFGSTLPQG